MQTLLKKLLFSLLIATTFLFSLAPFSQAKAQALWYNQSPFEWYSKVYDDTNSNEIFGERYTAAQVQWITYGIFFLPVNVLFSLLGVPPTPVVCISNAMAGVVDMDTCFEGLKDFMGSITGVATLPTNNNLYTGTEGDGAYIAKQILSGNRTLSGVGYVKNVVNKLKPVPSVKAADNSFGYNKLAVVSDLWSISRNVAYFFFVLATIITAFMVMFKVKISPQAVVTLQQAIPKIVITIILVTFSYAIAGFLVDLVYVVIGIFAQFFGSAINLGMGNANATWDFLVGWFPDGFINFLLYSVLYIVLTIVASILITAVSLITLNTASMIFGAILFIFFVINILILIVYIFIALFNLFKALAHLYMDVIFAPIMIGVGALPSSRGAFANWLKRIIGHLLVFPVTGILWYFGFLFVFKAYQAILYCFQLNNLLSWLPGAMNDLIAKFAPAGTTFGKMNVLTGACWGPPLLGNPGTATTIAFLLMSASCILLIAKAPKMIESAIQGKPFDMESAIGEPVKKAVNSAGSLAEGIGKQMTQNKVPAGPIVEAAGKIAQTISH